MTAVAREGMNGRLLHLLAHSTQLGEWAAILQELGTGGRRLAVAHGPTRTREADTLARRFGSRTAPLGTVDRLRRHLVTGDLLIVIAPADRRAPSIQSVDGLPALRDLLHDGVVIWGITGPHPNPLAPYCHDVIAVPTPDPLIQLRAHRLVIRRLTGSPPPGSDLAVVRTGEGSASSDT